MSRDNPLWGAERIRGELLQLGIVVSKRSIRRYRCRGGPRPPSQTRRTFLANHRPRIWAADLVTVQTLTFRTLYVLLFVAHGRRELIHLNVTSSPTAAWVWRQLVRATPWGYLPRFLIRDRDRVYGPDFPSRAAVLGIDTILTPVRAPRANAVAERGQRRRGTARRHPAPGVPRSPDRRQRTAPSHGAGGVRRLLQRRSPAPHARTPDAPASESADAWADPRQPRPRRSPPRR